MLDSSISLIFFFFIKKNPSQLISLIYRLKTLLFLFYLESYFLDIFFHYTNKLQIRQNLNKLNLLISLIIFINNLKLKLTQLILYLWTKVSLEGLIYGFSSKNDYIFINFLKLQIKRDFVSNF